MNKIRRVTIDDSSSDSSKFSDSSTSSSNDEVDSAISQSSDDSSSGSYEQEENKYTKREVKQQPTQVVKSPTTTTMSLDKWPIQILVVGPTEAGKTNLVKNIVLKIRDKFQYILAFCPTAKLNKDYDFLPKDYVVDWNEKLLETIVKQQEKYKEEGKEYHCLLIFDDIVGTIKTQNSDIFDKLASSSRHRNISIIYVVQQATKISTSIRTNVKLTLATQINKTESDILFDRSKCFKSKNEMWQVVNEKVNRELYKFLLLQNGNYSIITPSKCKKFMFKYIY